MGNVTTDDELLAHVREVTAARSTSQFPDSAVRDELAAAKTRINREVADAARTNTFDLYAGSNAARGALVAYMELRVDELVRQRTPDRARSDDPIPTAIGKLRRTEFADATLRHRRNQLITHLNALIES